MTDKFFPLWGGPASMIGSPWSLHYHTSSGIRSAGLFTNVFQRPDQLAPLRQRLLTTGISTAGVPLSSLEEEAIDDLPPLNAEGVEDPFEAMRYRERVKTNPPPKSNWSLKWSPFTFIARAIMLPIVGLVDIAISKASPTVFTVVSLVYQSLPLSSITRISRLVRILKRDPNTGYYRGPQTGDPIECKICKSSYANPYYNNTEYRGGVKKVQLSLYPRCEHGMLDWTFKYMVNKISYELSEYLPDRPDIGDKFVRTRRFKKIKPTYNVLPKVLRILNVKPSVRCSHPIVDHNVLAPKAYPPESTPDGLYTLPPHKIWRKENQAHGLRCVHCFKNTLHFWNPDVLLGIRRFVLKESLARLQGSEVKEYFDLHMWFLYLVNFSRNNLVSERNYILSSVTESRLSIYENLTPDAHHIVLVDSDRTSEVLRERYPYLDSPTNFVVVLPIFGNETCFGGWRLVLAAVCPLDCWFTIVNQKVNYYEPLALTIVENVKRTWSSCSPGHLYPFYMGAALVQGGTSLLEVGSLSMFFYLCGFCYGWDEIIPALWERLTTIMPSDPGLVPVMSPLVRENIPKWTIVNFLLVDGSSKIIGSYVTDFTRENIFIMKALSLGHIDVGRLTMAHAFADARPISEVSVTPDYQEFLWCDITPNSPRFVANSAPGENIISEISHTIGGIIFVTFGSRGDVNPIRANAKWLANLGTKVTLIRLNTEEEGKILASMDSRFEHERIRLFLRARDYITGFGDTKLLAPSQLFPLGHVTYTLAPPNDMVHPFVASNNVLLGALYTILGSSYEPDFRVGAFSTRKCLPTSADGVEFMKATLNISKPGTVAAYWGGDHVVPQGYEHIPLVASNDHTLEFPKLETLYTKGTVGTVALGALSGCKVVAVGDGLDRDYLQPYDAGSGFVDGQSPDRAFLALSSIHPAFLGVWLRTNWYNIPEFWAWFGPSGIGLLCFRTLMFYLYLTRLQKFSFLSTTPLSTLILMLDGRSTIPLRDLIKYLFVAKLCETTLTTIGRNYFWLAQRFVDLNSMMMKSSLIFWIAQSYGWGKGLLAAESAGYLVPALNWLVSWVPISLGASPDPPLPPDDEYAVLEFVLVYRYVPVVHTALVFPKSGIRIEGCVNKFGLYGAKARKGTFHSPFVFPTRLSFKYISSRLRTSSFYYYGPTWHCYSVIWDLAGVHTARLGVAAPIIIAVNACSAVLSTLTFVLLSACYGVGLILPAVGGINTRTYGIMNMLAETIRNTVDMIANTRGDVFHAMNTWFSRLTLLTPLPINLA